MLNKIISVVLILFLASPVFAAIDNLDEMAARKTRRGSNTYYTGAASSNYYVRQPETLVTFDAITGHEITILSNTQNEATVFRHEIPPSNSWSGDGKYLGLISTRDVSAFTRTAGSTFSELDKATPFIMRSDGSYLREAYQGSNRTWGSSGMKYFHWNPVDPDVYYMRGGTDNGQSLDPNGVYKNTVTDTSISYTLLVDTISSDTSTGIDLLKVISPDGSRMMTRSGTYPNLLYRPINVETGTVIEDGWNEDRGQTTEWSSGTLGCRHDSYFPNKDYFVLLFSEDCSGSTGGVFYKYNLTGSDSDGGPEFDSSETSYTTFNNFEVEPLWTMNTPRVPWYWEGGDGFHWWGHPSFGRWGRIVIVNDGNAYWDDAHTEEWSGPVAWDYVDREFVAEPTEESQPKTLIEKSAFSYTDWSAWSDFFVTSRNDADGDDDNTYIYTGEYNITYDDGNTAEHICNHHQNQNSSTEYHYTSNSRIMQSPDGTKVGYSITYMSSTANAGDIAYVVAYYPHPPEITSVSGGVVTFDWRTDQTTSRGYTQRGWPDEDTDDPPPPRETHYFRLWKSANGTTGWTPVCTVDADIFDKYNFADGTWSGSKSWTLTDPSPSGYYAVTAVEWSGLESHVLSNVYSSSGTQYSSYPSDPKADTGIVSSYDEDLVRYYNIYAEDGSDPTITQANRIASIPVASGINTYVDWLGNTAGATHYVVTAVDTQDNESSALTSSYEHKATGATADGQYTITWTAESSSCSACGTASSSGSKMGGASSFSHIGSGASQIKKERRR